MLHDSCGTDMMYNVADKNVAFHSVHDNVQHDATFNAFYMPCACIRISVADLKQLKEALTFDCCMSKSAQQSVKTNKSNGRIDGNNLDAQACMTEHQGKVTYLCGRGQG